jgi:hypothetical protein
VSKAVLLATEDFVAVIFEEPGMPEVAIPVDAMVATEGMLDAHVQLPVMLAVDESE